MKFSYRLRVLFIIGIFWPEGMLGTATSRSRSSPNESIKPPAWNKMAAIDSLNISDTWRHFLAAINCTSERCPENWSPDHRVTSWNPEPWNRAGVANVSGSRIFKDTFRLSGKNRYNFAHKQSLLFNFPINYIFTSNCDVFVLKVMQQWPFLIKRFFSSIGVAKE